MAMTAFPTQLLTLSWPAQEGRIAGIGLTRHSSVGKSKRMSETTNSISIVNELMSFDKSDDFAMSDSVPDQLNSLITAESMRPIDGELDGTKRVNLISSVPVSLDTTAANLDIEDHTEQSCHSLVPETCLREKPDFVHYATPVEWEAKRTVIQHLYIDQNLNLQDVMEIMKQRHNFRATKKMYKSRFATWKLRKYKNNQHPRRPNVPNQGRKSCLRRTDLRVKALLHESNTTKLKDQALTALLHFFRPVEPHKWLAVSAGYDTDYRISQAFCHLHNGNTAIAFSFIRHAFLSMELALQSPDGCAAFDLIPRVLGRLLLQKLEGILEMYLSHMAEISAAMQTRHPLGQVAKTLLELHRSGPNGLRHFIASAYEIRDNILTPPTIGSSDFLIQLRVACVKWKRRLKVWDGDFAWTVKQAADQYDECIEKETRAHGGACYEVLGLEYDRLKLQYANEIYMDDFMARGKKLQKTISNKYEEANFPRGGWTLKDARMYLRCGCMLAVFSLEMGDLASTLSWLRKFSNSDAHKISTACPELVDLEWELRRKGLADEADKLAQDLHTARVSEVGSLGDRMGSMNLNDSKD